MNDSQAQAIKVARTIFEQLGGQRFAAMTGAKDLVTASGGRGLSFRLPSYMARKGINAVRITLEASDLYTVEFSKLRGQKFTPVSKSEGIYADGLAAVFTTETGLFTAL